MWRNHFRGSILINDVRNEIVTKKHQHFLNIPNENNSFSSNKHDDIDVK